MKLITKFPSPARVTARILIAAAGALPVLISAGSAALSAAPARGESPAEPPAEPSSAFHLPHGAARDLDALLAEHVEPHEPGFAAAVFRDGDVLYHGIRGMANLDHAIPLSESSRFYVASLSKQVTAAAAALLIADGKLALEERVADLLENWPDWAEAVRVEHLLYHTAGLPDFIELLAVADLSIADPLTLDDYLGVVLNAGALNHEAGARAQFSNSNYLVLAAIIEQVSGRSLNSFAAERLFEPLGMRHTHFHDDRRRVIPDRVIGYRRSAGAPAGFAQAYINTYQEYGAGGLYTTVEDWGRWDSLRTGDPLGLGEEVSRLVERPGRTTGGTQVNYSFGLQLDSWNELRRVGHDGRFMGFRHDYRHLPEKGVSIAVFANRSDIDAGAVLERIGEIILAGALEEWMQPYLGSFVNRELEVTYELGAERGRLYLKRPSREPAALSYQGGHRWRLGTWLLRFDQAEPREAEDANDELRAPVFDRFYLSTPRAFNVEFERRH